MHTFNLCTGFFMRQMFKQKTVSLHRTTTLSTTLTRSLARKPLYLFTDLIGSARKKKKYEFFSLLLATLSTFIQVKLFPGTLQTHLLL